MFSARFAATPHQLIHCFSLLLYIAPVACGDDSYVGAAGGSSSSAGGNSGGAAPNGGAGACGADWFACTPDAESHSVCCPDGQMCCSGLNPSASFCARDPSECVNTCKDGSTCPSTAYCQEDHQLGTYRCVEECPYQARCGTGTCCPIGTRCTYDADSPENSRCELANLTVDATVLAGTLLFEMGNFSPTSCELEEACILSAGPRRLLRFSVQTPNTGLGDLFVGPPGMSEHFVFSPCHNHYHFQGYAVYELLDASEAVVLTGHKQAFCMVDSEKLEPDAGPARYDCNYQGISKGWADVYKRDLSCQWLDITGLPSGEYRLRIRLNYDRVLAESEYDDNEVTIPVTIEDPL